MNRLVSAALAAAASLVLMAGTTFDYHEGEVSEAIVSPEMQQAAAAMLGVNGDALLHAMRLQMAKYDNDMRTKAGRASWHGRLVAVDYYTNELYAVETWSNEVTGAIWKYRKAFQPTSVRIAPRTVQFTTNGLPRRLAAARARRAAELNGGAAVTNVVIEANH